MICLIDNGKGICVMYDSASQWAFGPVLSSEVEAKAFLAFLGPLDPRLMVESELETRYWDFRQVQDAEHNADVDRRAADRADA